MLSAFANSLRVPELRQRIFFTVGLIAICRLLASVPTPGVDAVALRELMRQIHQSAGGSFLGLFNMFSGGALAQCAVGSLGIMPYISASIILQLMTAVVPALERLAREGRTEIAQACFDFLPARARLDLAGWPDHDIFSHESA